MKILVIGDPHGKLPKGLTQIVRKNKPDILVVLGDFGTSNKVREICFGEKEGKTYSNKEKRKALDGLYNSTLKVVKNLSGYCSVYVLYGNLEALPTILSKKKTFAEEYNLTSKLNSIKDIKVIENSFIKVEGVKIGFLEYFIDDCWVREFKPGDYKNKLKKAKKETTKAKKILKRFGKLDILVCHQPPYGYLDKVNFKGAPKNWQGKHAGSKVILNYIKKYQPKYVLCGHIHEAKGKKKIGKTTVINVGAYGDYFIISI